MGSVMGGLVFAGAAAAEKGGMKREQGCLLVL
jgi:hypothetical protein